MAHTHAVLAIVAFFSVATKIHYVCNQNYEPIGDVQQTCLEGGVWSNAKPVCSLVTTTPIADSFMEINSNTMTIVIATSCSVLGLLLVVMVIVALQRRKSAARLCHPAQPPPSPTPYTRPRTDSIDEHDRVALIAFADGVQVALPAYEEATRGRSGAVSTRYYDAATPSSRRQPEYRPLPTIPASLRGSRHESIRSGGNAQDHHRNSIITTTSSTTRDNMSIAFGSMDTVNVSDGTSTTVTIETYDSGASNPSLALSQRAVAGSMGSSNGSLATEDAPLLDQTNENNHRNQGETTPAEEEKQD